MNLVIWWAHRVNITEMDCLTKCLDHSSCRFVETEPNTDAGNDDIDNATDEDGLCALYSNVTTEHNESDSTSRLFYSVPGCYHTLNMKWQQVDIEKPFTFVTRGQAGLWAVTRQPPPGQIYVAQNTYNKATMNSTDVHEWDLVDGHLTHIYVGQDMVCGVNRGHLGYCRYGIGENSPFGGWWMHIAGGIVSMSLGHEPSEVWIATSSGLMFIEVSSAPPASGSYNWTQIEDAPPLRSVSVGKTGVWVVKYDGSVYVRKRNETGNDWSSFRPVDGVLSEVLTGDSDLVMGFDMSAQLLYRIGITDSQPLGVAWAPFYFFKGPVEQVFVYRDEVWLMTKSWTMWMAEIPDRDKI